MVDFDQNPKERDWSRWRHALGFPIAERSQGARGLRRELMWAREHDIIHMNSQYAVESPRPVAHREHAHVCFQLMATVISQTSREFGEPAHGGGDSPVQGGREQKSAAMSRQGAEIRLRFG